MSEGRFLYRFGYQTSSQIGSDDEDSQCVWIVADGPQAALAWGQQISERYVSDHWPGAPSWLTAGYANWIETADHDALAWADAHSPTCVIGEFPEI